MTHAKNVVTKRMDDGVKVEWCSPHRRWEWTCEVTDDLTYRVCGQVNTSRDRTCRECGTNRKEATR